MMLRLFSPAKINLFLRVVGKGDDHYHRLSSVFQTISLGDTLLIEAAQADQLSCSGFSVPLDHSNLILKALMLFRQKTGATQNFRVHVIKGVPMQAGLGGGSSNAATTLWACNRLLRMRIPLPTLMAWGAELGSDVPFFFSQGTAYCQGRGERVQPLDPLMPQMLWIVKPTAGLATAEVFRHLQLTQTGSSCSDDLSAFLSGSWLATNDLEASAFMLNPSLQELKRALLAGGFNHVAMTGSGTAFYCMGQGVFPKREDLMIWPVHFISRYATRWYQTPACSR